MTRARRAPRVTPVRQGSSSSRDFQRLRRYEKSPEALADKRLFASKQWKDLVREMCYMQRCYCGHGRGFPAGNPQDPNSLDHIVSRDAGGDFWGRENLHPVHGYPSYCVACTNQTLPYRRVYCNALKGSGTPLKLLRKLHKMGVKPEPSWAKWGWEDELTS